MALYSNINKSKVEQAQSQKEVTLNEAIEALALYAGITSKNVAAGGAFALSEDESRAGVKILTGAAAGAVTVTQDADVTVASFYKNDTTGGQTIQVRIGAGTLFTVPAGGWLLLLSTTAAMVFHSDTTPGANSTAGTAGTASTFSRSDHKHPRDVETLVFNTATATWTDMPLAETEFLGLTDRRQKYDLTQFSQVRLQANVEVVGATGAKLRAQYSTDQSAWNDIEDGGGSGPEVAIDALGLAVSSYVTIPAGAQADVFLRVVGIDGDGAADPQIGLVTLQCK